MKRDYVLRFWLDDDPELDTIEKTFGLESLNESLNEFFMRNVDKDVNRAFFDEVDSGKMPAQVLVAASLAFMMARLKEMAKDSREFMDGLRGIFEKVRDLHECENCPDYDECKLDSKK